MVVEVLIKKCSESASIPVQMTEHASGYDLFAEIKSDIVLLPGERAVVNTGISIALPESYEAQIRPRSGLAKALGITLLNSPGTIDADYRGEIKVIVVNHGEKPVRIKRGQRVAQMVIVPVEKVCFVQKDELPFSFRGNAGFGHTGV